MAAEACGTWKDGEQTQQHEDHSHHQQVDGNVALPGAVKLVQRSFMTNETLLNSALHKFIKNVYILVTVSAAVLTNDELSNGHDAQNHLETS